MEVNKLINQVKKCLLLVIISQSHEWQPISALVIEDLMTVFITCVSYLCANTKSPK